MLLVIRQKGKCVWARPTQCTRGLTEPAIQQAREAAGRLPTVTPGYYDIALSRSTDNPWHDRDSVIDVK